MKPSDRFLYVNIYTENSYLELPESPKDESRTIKIT